MYKRRIRVLQLGSPHGLYGAERWILALIKYLDTTKIESWVVAIKDEPQLEVPLCKEAEKLGFQARLIESYGKFNLSAVNQLRKFIIENKIDIIHTHHYKTDIIGLLSTIGTSCRAVSTPHGWTNNPDMKLWMYEMFDRLIFPFFDAVVPLSEALYKSLASILVAKKKLYFIKNGVDINEIDEIQETADDMSVLKDEGGIVIGYIGRLVAGKGLDILLNAVAHYGEPNWKVIIIGDGDMTGQLNSMIKELNIASRVKILGFRPDRLAYLKSFDVFVLPSRSEGIPRCLMEAMAAGIPVVASDIPGCRQLVNGGTTGLLFPVDEPRELSECIKRITTDNILKENLSQNARNFIQCHFSAKKMAEEYQALFFKIVGSPLAA